MDKLVQFLLTSGDKLTVAGLLSAGFALTVIALYREWIVLGKPYHACMTRVEEFEKIASARATANESKVADLEERIKTLIEDRDHRRR